LQLHGDADTCVLPASAQGSGKYVAAPYEWHVLEGVGHFPPEETPDVVTGEIVRWAKQ
jgi:pimeloyl-ACP methyl ester carboxylesterase